MARGYDKGTIYRVTWASGDDAVLAEYDQALRAAVLDTALDHAVKVSKKWGDVSMVWECGEGGNVVRAFGTKLGLRWPEKLPCKACKGSGKVWKSSGGWSGANVRCDDCHGCGRRPDL